MLSTSSSPLLSSLKAVPSTHFSPPFKVFLNINSSIFIYFQVKLDCTTSNQNNVIFTRACLWTDTLPGASVARPFWSYTHTNAQLRGPGRVNPEIRPMQTHTLAIVKQQLIMISSGTTWV